MSRRQTQGRKTRRWKPALAWFAAAAWLHLGSLPVHAQTAEVNIQDVFAGYGFGAGSSTTLKLGHFVPFSVQFEVSKGSFRGEIEVWTPDSDGNDVLYTIPNIFVPENVNRTLASAQGLVKFGKDRLTLEVRAVAVNDAGGRTEVARRTFTLGGIGNSNSDVVGSTSQLVVSLGEVGGLYQIKELGKPAQAFIGQESPPRAVRFRSEKDLPAQWYGYSSVDAFVFATSDEKTFDRLTPQHASAIRTWVRQGGRLVVCVSKNWQIVSKSFLGPMLPAELVGADEVDLLKSPVRNAIESFAGGKDRLAVTKETSFAIAKLDKLRKPGKVLLQANGRPIVYAAAYGLGHVTLVAFDPNTSPFVNWPEGNLFWAKTLKLDIPTDPSQGRGYINTSDEAALLSNYIEDFPEVAVVPFHWVALLIFIYILLIGPVDYFFLKKVVKRLELTWITFPTWVVLISLGAYYSAYFLKGDSLRINRLEIVDVDSNTGTLRGAGFTCLFSPRIHSYDLAFSPGLAAVGEWSSLAASPTNVEAGGMGDDQTIALTSWHGIPEQSFRGMAGDGGAGLLGRRKYDLQTYLGGSIIGVNNAPIQVWSTKSFESRWLARGGPVIDAKLQMVGFGVRGSVKNLLKVPLENALLVYGERAWYIPKLDPNLEVDIAAINPRNMSDAVGKVRANNEPSMNAIQPATQLAKIDEYIRGLMFFKARGDVGRGRSTAANHVGFLDLSSQLELGRAVLLAKLPADQAGGKFWLEQPPDKGEPKNPDAKTVHHTFIRVVFDPAVKETQ